SVIRHIGGAKLNQALVWNVRTWPAMPREKVQAAPTARPKVPMRRRGADCLVMSIISRLCRWNLSTNWTTPATLDNKTREETNELTKMMKGNLERVVQHGKSGDSIVKNMLLHSREGSGERRLGDLNAIVEH